MAASSAASNDEWFAANLLDLVQKYPNQWIAVLDGNVICTSSSRRRARGEARRIAAGREFSLYFIEPSMLQMGFARGTPPPEQPPH
ncbi:MAG TPA: DUF5678 domain-containing protein [Thermoplasmata archaeon]|nr:DUF5678 domain-containing protein [Thermoplasmata archaeon]